MTVVVNLNCLACCVVSLVTVTNILVCIMMLQVVAETHFDNNDIEHVYLCFENEIKHYLSHQAKPGSEM